MRNVEVSLSSGSTSRPVRIGLTLTASYVALSPLNTLSWIVPNLYLYGEPFLKMSALIGLLTAWLPALVFTALLEVWRA